MTRKQIRFRLAKLANIDHAKFSASLTPNCGKMLGVPTPQLREFAKEIAKNGDFFEDKIHDTYEETLLEGMAIGYAANGKNISETLKLVKKFIKKIDNWAVCDGFCSTLKIAKKHRGEFWKFIAPYFNSKKEFESRFAYVMLLGYFIDKEYLDFAFDKLSKLKSQTYYAQMGVAWAVSVCCAKFPKETILFLQKNLLDNFTHNKSIQKCIESFRVSQKDKSILRNLKRVVSKKR